MFYPLSWFIGLRYTLTRRRTRSVSFISAIAMTGIVLGVALLITVLSVMNGFDRELRQRILSIMPQITLYQRGGVSDWISLRQQILSVDQVVAATPFVEIQAMLHQGRHTQPVLIYGVDNELETTVSRIDHYLDKGTLSRLAADTDTLALGSGIAEKLSVKVGDSLTLIVPQPDSSQRAPAFRRVTVIDVFNSGTELDHSLSLMGLVAATDLSLNSETVTGLHIKGTDLFQAPSIAAGIRAILPEGYYTSDWTRTHGNIYYAIRMSKNLVTLLLLLIIAIAAFNVVSTLVMVVVDKQGDIAILRTLGANNRQVMATFMVQGTVIGVIGTGVGALLGVLLALTVDDMVAFLEVLFNVRFLKSDIYPVSFLPSALAWQDVALVVSVSLVMSLLATWYPARKAASVAPAEALRYD